MPRGDASSARGPRARVGIEPAWSEIPWMPSPARESSRCGERACDVSSLESPGSACGCLSSMTEVERAPGHARRGWTRGHAPGSARRRVSGRPRPPVLARPLRLGTRGPVGRLGDSGDYGLIGPRARPRWMARAALRAAQLRRRRIAWRRCHALFGAARSARPPRFSLKKGETDRRGDARYKQARTA